MLFLLSPAKTLDDASPLPDLPHTLPAVAEDPGRPARRAATAGLDAALPTGDGTALQVGHAANLYQYWGSRIAEALNAQLAADRTPVVVNLASQECSRAVDRHALKARMIDCVFEEWRPGGWKIISFAAKKARGLMARFAITRRIETPRRLEHFNLEGYAFDAAASQPERLVFRRRTAT